MTAINLKLSKKLFVPKFYPLLFDYSHRWELYMGSAGSAKSYFITQKIIMRCLREPIKVLVCRRYGSTLRNSCFSLFKDILQSWKIKEYCKINETDMTITFPNESQVIFLGLDQETKLLSLNNIGSIFVEEAFEVSKDIVEQLNLRMRPKIKNPQIFLAWNPISKKHWLYSFKPSNSIFTHSTYKDNPFLTKEYVEALEDLYVTNPSKAKIYCDGEWGNPEEGKVFTDWSVEDFDLSEVLKIPKIETRIGCDLGYIDPSTIVCSLYDKANKTIYVYDGFAQSGLMLDEFASILEEKAGRRTKVYMDSAEPRSIEFMRRAGINAKPCVKGQGSVKARIMFLQNNHIIVKPSCLDLIEELEEFSYIKDKKTGQYTEETTHEHSHSIDGLGYAYSDIYTKKPTSTIDKSMLGL